MENNSDRVSQRNDKERRLHSSRDDEIGQTEGTTKESSVRVMPLPDEPEGAPDDLGQALALNAQDISGNT